MIEDPIGLDLMKYSLVISKLHFSLWDAEFVLLMKGYNSKLLFESRE